MKFFVYSKKTYGVNMTHLGKVQSLSISFASSEPKFKQNATLLCNPRWEVLTNESSEASGLAKLVYTGKTSERPYLKEGRKWGQTS